MKELKYTNKRRVPGGIKRQKETWVTATCYCGKTFEVRLYSLKSGVTKSCGCYRRKKISDRNRTHSLTRTSTYNSWQSMRVRCNDKNHVFYLHYGGRGITYPKRWDVFVNFLKDMGERPENTSLDRIDNNKSYSKRNCRWSSQKEQNRNTRYSIKYKGEHCIEASLRLGGHRQLVYSRIKNMGWDIKTAFNTPPKK